MDATILNVALPSLIDDLRRRSWPGSSVGGSAGASVLAAARAALDGALATTAHVSAGIALAATVLVPRGFTVTAAH